MNKLLLITSFSLLSFLSFAADVITLNNQMAFSGKVFKIDQCMVKFRSGGEVFIIPADDIYTINFENPNDRVLRRYENLSDPEKCLKGRNDADLYHGKAGAHIALGVLFGPFAIIGAAVADPIPSRGKDTYMMSKNQELFSDPAYLSCYRKTAKGKNVGNTALGWGAWILFLLAV